MKKFECWVDLTHTNLQYRYFIKAKSKREAMKALKKKILKELSKTRIEIDAYDILVGDEE